MKKTRKTRWREAGAGRLRLGLVALSVLAQALFIILLALLLKDYAALVYMLLQAAGMLLAVVLVVRRTSPGFTIAWMLILLTLPVMGILLYLSWSSAGFAVRADRLDKRSWKRVGGAPRQDTGVWQAFSRDNPARVRFAAVLRARGYPLYRYDGGGYYPSGEMWFDTFFQVLEQAERSIYLSFFIIEPGKLWDRTRDILYHKAAKGVDIRLIFDDFGCVATLPRGFAAELKAHGIRAAAFNPIHRHMQRLHLNYRDHQKLVVVDGHTALTGGLNLGDAYANLETRCGHWKDTGICVTGKAVYSFTVIFLRMWDMAAGRFEGDTVPCPPAGDSGSQGYVLPFAGGPSDSGKGAAEDIYRLIAATARQYAYFTTPYLAPDYTMQETLCLAARGGIDVRVITPHIPDHKMVHMVTRSYYRRLLEGGVRIFEYTPGFIHAKMALCDGECAVVGTINMDSRSFYQHYENAVWLCATPEVQAIGRDFDALFAQCQEIRLESWKARPPLTRAMEGALNLFSPLM